MYLHRPFIVIALTLLSLPNDARISVAEFKPLHAARSVLTIDVRSAVNYQHGHIADAINVPLAEMAARLRQIRSAAGGRGIVTYCSCPNEHTSGEAVVTLTKAGFKNVKALVGGYPEWVLAGGRVDRP